MKFKIGDIVKVKRGWISDYENEKGRVVDVTKLGNFTIEFESEYLSRRSFFESSLVFISNEKETNFKVGDSVKIKDTLSVYNNEIGEIIKIEDSYIKYPFVVRFRETISYYAKNNLELVEIDKMKELKEKYKEAYKQYEETKEIEKDLIVKTRSNIKKQNELMETISSLSTDILNEAKK